MATGLPKETALYWDCRWLSEGRSDLGSAPRCSYPSSLHSVTAWWYGSIKGQHTRCQCDSERPSETRGQDCLGKCASDWVTNIASCSTRVLLERLPSLSNSCAVVTAHTHLKTNPFQMESYKLPQVFSSSSTLQASFFYFIPGILEDWSA